MVKMSYSDPKKVFKQLEKKPAKLKKFMKHNLSKKRTTGKSLKKCELTGRIGAHIKMYGLNLSRQTFRENAKKLGFKKYN